MKILKTAFFVGTLLTTLHSYADRELPHFDQYKVDPTEIFKGTPAPVDLSSHKGATTYKSKLTEGAKAGPNFAGHYTIVTYGCGTQCQDNWIIDAKTGKIIDRFDSVVDSQYQLNSDLLIINAPDAELKKAYEEHPEQPLLGTLETIYKTMKNNKLEILHTEKWVDVIKTLK